MPFELKQVLTEAIKAKASDIHLKAGLPPMFRIDGEMRRYKSGERLTADTLSNVASSLMNSTQKERFKKQRDIDLAYSLTSIGRFRINIFLQRGSIGIVFRSIPFKVPSFKSLGLPGKIQEIAQETRGLILVTGATGSGKSTTLASMIEYINSTRSGHVVMIEDPIEFLIRDNKCIINQREIGSDAIDFPQALKAGLRQDPDVILVGEMRDTETIQIALTAAETGHLVLSTLHTQDAAESIQRIVSVFPPHQHQQTRQRLSSLLNAVICQRLVTRQDNRGRVPAVEIMVSTARIRECIQDQSRLLEISTAIAEGQDSYGMQSFDQSLRLLLEQGFISYDEALKQASKPADFALRVSGIEDGSREEEWKKLQDDQNASNKRKTITRT